MELTEGQAQRREDEVAAELGKMDRVTEDVSTWWQNHRRELSDADNERRQKEQDGSAIREEEITDPMTRWAEACGKYSDMRDPYGSLATAARAEGSIFRKQQEDLRQAEARESDPVKREMLQLRRHIEASEYMSVTSERLAGISAEILHPEQRIRAPPSADSAPRPFACRHKGTARSLEIELDNVPENCATCSIKEGQRSISNKEVARLQRQAREDPFGRRMNEQRAVNQKEPELEDRGQQFFGVAQPLPENAPNRDRPQKESEQYARPDHDPEKAGARPYRARCMRPGDSSG